MSIKPGMSEDSILTKVSQSSFERGRAYYNSGMIQSVIQRGDWPYVEVSGSEWQPYRVDVSLHEDDFSASCTCPYDWGGYCKHVVAAMLIFIHDNHLDSVRPPSEDLLSKLGASELRALLIRIVDSDPELADLVDWFCAQVWSTRE